MIQVKVVGILQTYFKGYCCFFTDIFLNFAYVRNPMSAGSLIRYFSSRFSKHGYLITNWIFGRLFTRQCIKDNYLSQPLIG